MVKVDEVEKFETGRKRWRHRVAFVPLKVERSQELK